MSEALSRFLKQLILLTTVIAVIMGIVFGFFLRAWYIPVLPFLLLFFFGFTLLTYFWLNRISSKDFGKFIRTRIGITILRLLVYVLITILYMAFIKQGVICFVMVLGILYLIYTSFEVYMLATGKNVPGRKQDDQARQS